MIAFQQNMWNATWAESKKRLEGIRRDSKIPIVPMDRDADAPIVVGYSTLWGTPTDRREDGKHWIFAPGAFADQLSDATCVYLYREHSFERCFGATEDGSLDVAEDDLGLRFSCSLPRTTEAFIVREIYRGGGAFGASMHVEALESSERPPCIRWITKAHVDEVTITPRPANQATAVQLIDPNRDPRPFDHYADAGLRLRQVELESRNPLSGTLVEVARERATRRLAAMKSVRQ